MSFCSPATFFSAFYLYDQQQPPPPPPPPQQQQQQPQPRKSGRVWNTKKGYKSGGSNGGGGVDEEEGGGEEGVVLYLVDVRSVEGLKTSHKASINDTKDTTAATDKSESSSSSSSSSSSFEEGEQEQLMVFQCNLTEEIPLFCPHSDHDSRNTPSNVAYRLAQLLRETYGDPNVHFAVTGKGLHSVRLALTPYDRFLLLTKVM